ncbi:TIGR04104 family putative zinc finger protein [Alkalihalobacillus sp. AL-G]|uniref:TIGR04104 family putative zinc finger protein n=1 Tax=Alkalihalobacillus sp. AL-G TaxID=2926399 RepID=UPI00351B5E8A
MSFLVLPSSQLFSHQNSSVGAVNDSFPHVKTNCNRKWTWKQTIINLFKIRKRICPYCKKKQFLSAKSRNNLSLLGIIPLPLGTPLSSFGASTVLFIGIYRNRFYPL